MLHIDGIIFSLQKFGGISVYFTELLKFLQARGERYRLLLENPSHPLQIEDFASFPIDHRESRWLERYRACRMMDRPKIFHSSYYRKPECSLVPTVVTAYDFIYERQSSGIKRMVHSAQKDAAIRRAQSVICISEATKRELLYFVGEIPGQTIHVIHCGVSETFKPLGLVLSKKPYFLFVGQRGGYKNFSLAVAAMEHLPDLGLLCVGGGKITERELENSSSSTRQRIKHVGFVSDEILNELYNEAVCLVYPSSHEGFGIPVVEAMRAGCPVVSVNCEAVLEVGGSALTVASESDPRSLADGINKTRSSGRSLLISKGFEVSGQYSWKSAHEKTLGVYRSLGL